MEDDDPSLEEFRVHFNLCRRNACKNNELIDRAVALFARMFSEDVTSRQEAGAAADAEASAPDHDVAVLGAAVRSNAISPPDGASEERLCNQSLAIKNPQFRWGFPPTKFGDRISAIKYLLELNYLTHGPDDRLIRNRTKPRDVHLPFIEGNPKVAVRTVIGWHKKSLPTEEDWEGMRADPDLEKELGEDWFFARSRMPRTWIHKLNQRRSAAGLSVKAVPAVSYTHLTLPTSDLV